MQNSIVKLVSGSGKESEYPFRFTLQTQSILIF